MTYASLEQETRLMGRIVASIGSKGDNCPPPQISVLSLRWVLSRSRPLNLHMAKTQLPLSIYVKTKRIIICWWFSKLLHVIYSTKCEIIWLQFLHLSIESKFSTRYSTQSIGPDQVQD